MIEKQNCLNHAVQYQMYKADDTTLHSSAVKFSRMKMYKD